MSVIVSLISLVWMCYWMSWKAFKAVRGIRVVTPQIWELHQSWKETVYQCHGLFQTVKIRWSLITGSASLVTDAKWCHHANHSVQARYNIQSIVQSDNGFMKCIFYFHTSCAMCLVLKSLAISTHAFFKIYQSTRLTLFFVSFVSPVCVFCNTPMIEVDLSAISEYN